MTMCFQQRYSELSVDLSHISIVELERQSITRRTINDKNEKQKNSKIRNDKKIVLSLLFIISVVF